MGCVTALAGALMSWGSRPGPAEIVLGWAWGLIFTGPCPFGNRAYAARTVGAVVAGLKYPPGPTAITTNCFFVFFPRYVIGVACALDSSLSTQSSFPVRASNARKRGATVPPMETKPPAGGY